MPLTFESEKSKCDECGYIRKSSDKGPTWQCPQCSAAYSKSSRPSLLKKRLKSKFKPSHLRTFENAALHRLAQLFNILILGVLVLFALAYFNKGTLPNTKQLNSALQNEPVQTAITQEHFTFNYRGNKITAKPIAAYELWGLVVSHNDINGFIYGYDENSVNQKDICVVWGKNLANNDFHYFKIWNQTWTCNIEIAPAYTSSFHMDKLSNNHLISNNENLQNKIRAIHVGDQIHIHGYLVNYTAPEMGGAWRNSSLKREDVGNGACEIIFVTSLEILKAATPAWYKLYDICKYLLIFLVIVRLAIPVIDLLIAPY